MSTDATKNAADPDASTAVQRPGPVTQAAVVWAVTFSFSGAGYSAGLPVIDDRYEALEEVGRGGNGVVYRARDRHTDTTVALKVVSLFGATDDEIERQLREATCGARVRHPNVIRLLDSGLRVGLLAHFHFLVFEFAPGGTLRARLAATEPLTAWVAARLLLPVVRGVAAAHDEGVVHRDLKPANILLDADGNLKIADFGMSKGAGDQTVTVSGEVMGTPSYMSPEQARGGGKAATPAADVWSLGAILYECLTGAPPFTADDVCRLLDLVGAPDDRVTVDSLGLRVPGVPDDFDAVVMKCLSKDPRARYPHAGELAADLERFLADLPVLAPPLFALPA